MSSPMIVARATKAYVTCDARNRAGTPCQRPAGWGTDSDSGRCKLHGGRTPSGKKHAAMLTARQQLTELTRQPLTPEQYVDPIGALLFQLTMASMMESACREQVTALESWTGDVLSLTKDGFPVPTSEDTRAIVKLHLEWHKAAVSAAKACAAAKIDERVTQLAERQGAMLDAAFRVYMQKMGYDAERQSEGRKVFAAAFRELQPKLVGG